MKILKIAIAILLFTITANAQITKGNWIVGGTGNFSSYETKYSNNGNEVTNKGIGINISPNIGYFFINNLAVGTSIGIGYTKPKDSESSFGYGFGPFARYYFLKPEKTINILSQVGYYYGTSSSDTRFNNFNFKVGPVIYFNSSVGLELTIDYSITNNSSQFSENKIKAFNVGFGLQIHLEK